MTSSNTATQRSLPEWLSYLEAIHPATIELGLERTQSVFSRLGLSFSGRIVTVAGTNGKGTTCRTIESLALAQGLRTGVYSSPHILDYRERVRVNDKILSETRHCRAFEQVELARQDTSLTYFEFGTLAALVLLAEDDPDIILLEVGLGGRLDAVNIIDPDVAVITTIDLDHQDWLGDTREKIAQEKAGILRYGIPAVIGEPAPPVTLQRQVRELQCQAVWQGEEFGVSDDDGRLCVWHNGFDSVFLSQTVFPVQNMATAIATGRALGWQINQLLVDKAFSGMSLPGRCQVIQTTPEVMVDVAHNPQATGYLIEQIKKRTWQQLHLVCGMLSDKDSRASLEPFTALSPKWYLAQVNSPRSASIEVLKSCLSEKQPCSEFDSVAGAYSAALTSAGTEDLIVVFGSFFTVADVFAFLSEQQEIRQE